MLVADKLDYIYDSGSFALWNVGFSLPRGQIVGLLGENGAGKTTLIKCIMGIYKPLSGKISLDGESGEGIRKKLSYISGAGSAVGSFTPRGLMLFLSDFYPKFLTERCNKLLDFFELPERPIARMSTGEKAKAELAIGVCKGADYILMDEPFSNKDVFTRRDFLKILAGSLREDESILISTHLVDEIENFIDRALILHKGRLAADACMDELRQKRTSLTGLLGEVTGYKESRVFEMFGSSGCQDKKFEESKM